MYNLSVRLNSGCLINYCDSANCVNVLLGGVS
jgi:hypothetical protein